MTLAEISNEFDILWDNLVENNSSYPSLNEYEKSVFLTNAQEEIVKNYFNAKGNKYQEGFDDSIKRLTDFSELVKTLTSTGSKGHTTIDPRSRLVNIDDVLFFIINEVASYTISGKTYRTSVVPITYTGYQSLATKAYFQPPKNTTWRLMRTANSGTSVELIPHSKYDNSEVSYVVRYVKKPKPIILEDLSTNFGSATIDGVSNSSECELNPIIHREIINRAVVLAKNSLFGNLQSDIQLEQRSE